MTVVGKTFQKFTKQKNQNITEEGFSIA